MSIPTVLLSNRTSSINHFLVCIHILPFIPLHFNNVCFQVPRWISMKLDSRCWFFPRLFSGNLLPRFFSHMARIAAGNTESLNLYKSYFGTPTDARLKKVTSNIQKTKSVGILPSLCTLADPSLQEQYQRWHL